MISNERGGTEYPRTGGMGENTPFAEQSRKKEWTMVVTMDEGGQSTHEQGEWVKIPLLANKVGKRSGTMVRTMDEGGWV